MFEILAKNKMENLPRTSGAYLFYNKNKIIYIGKAINIKDRVKNHFNSARNASHSDAGEAAFKDSILAKLTTKIGFLKTNSEIEALILEANLIKKYQPKFNVIWKDDKNYFYVAVTKSEKPVVYITHQRNDNAEYVGPFVEGTALKKTLRFLRRVFPYYTTARHPKTKCTYCHLDLCPGPDPDLKEYKKNLKKLILILQGKRSAVLNSLKKEMRQLSKKNKFEEAGKVRDKIYALQQVMSHTHVIEAEREMVGFFARAKNPTISLAKIIGIEKISKIECYDVSNIQGKHATGSMIVFIDGGHHLGPDKSQYKKFKIRIKNEPNDIAMLKEVLQRRFLHPEWIYPEVILIDGGKAQLNAGIETKKYLPAGRQVKIISIAKGRQELFIEGKNPPAGGPIPLKQLPQEVYNLIKQLDDEAHRFALTYHRKLRSSRILK